jgi:hypothetical protein
VAHNQNYYYEKKYFLLCDDNFVFCKWNAGTGRLVAAKIIITKKLVVAQ